MVKFLFSVHTITEAKQSNRQGIARAVDLPASPGHLMARPGVAPPLVVTLSRPHSSSSLKVNNRSFRHSSPCLWNQLPKELHLHANYKDLSL